MDEVIELYQPRDLHALYVCLEGFIGNKSNYEPIPILDALQEAWCEKLKVPTPKTLSSDFLQALLLSLLKREKAALRELKMQVGGISI